MFLADFHIHSNFSDGQCTIPELVDFYGQQGFGAIAITDHLCEEVSLLGKAAKYLNLTLTRQSFPEYIAIIKEEAERAWRQYGMVVLPGYELTKNRISNSRSAHMLAIGVEEFISADADAEVLADRIRNIGGLAVAAHPVNTRKVEKQTYHLWDRREELSEHFDAWEVASGARIFSEVMESGLPMLANSDLHRPQQMSSWKTVIDSERHPEAIKAAIRKQHLSFRFFEGDANLIESIRQQNQVTRPEQELLDLSPALPNGVFSKRLSIG